MGKILTNLAIVLLLCSPYIAVNLDNMVEGGQPTYVLSDTTFLRGPTVNMVTNNSATVFWRTDSISDSIVHYGENMSLLESTTNTTLVTDHLVTLDSLSIDTKYYYKIESDGVESEVYFFYTSPADGEEFRLIIAGDNRPDGSEHPNQPEVFSELVDLMIQEEPHLVIILGDFVYSVTTTHSENLNAWKLLTDISDRIGHYAPVIGVIGNHDTGVSYGTYQIEYYLDAFLNTGENSTYFSFDYAGVHFTVLDSEEEDLEGHITGTQYSWLEQDLTENQDKMKFVFAHRPLYSTTHIGSSLDLDAEEQAALQQLFEDTNVSIFAAGHDHAFSRLAVNGVTHLISGGLGAPMYNSPWSDAIYHYVVSNVSHHAIKSAVIKNNGATHTQFDLPLEGPIEIVDRIYANTSSKPIGTVPVIFFSEVPVTKYFSWDGGENTTEISGLPGPEGEHILDVYAENDEGVWSSARFVFNTIVPDTISDSSTTSDTPDAGDLDIIFVAGIAGIIGVVVVLLVVVKIRKG